eukprot:TRINITY_DN47697_c0_g1_i1.p2 TRINITY_DN47697_c0_g1~~TRINITY_DN47697_c0_g1_i1.p2  ORF type:complete len:142 (+),score=10.35 TRINITY_DN47697_c0_g1_i1:166-591(+)
MTSSVTQARRQMAQSDGYFLPSSSPKCSVSCRHVSNLLSVSCRTARDACGSHVLKSRAPAMSLLCQYAKGTQHMASKHVNTAYVLVQVRALLLTLWKPDYVEPEEDRGNNEDAKRAIPDNQVHAVRAAETMCMRLNSSHSS